MCEYLEACLPNYMVRLLIFVRNHLPVFQSNHTILQSYLQWMRVPIVLRHFHNLLLSNFWIWTILVGVSEKAMAPHSSTLAWKIPWVEEPGGLQSMGSQRVGHDWDFTFTFHFHALEKAMSTHSSALAWRIPGTEEHGGLPSMGSHSVGYDWSDLAAAAVGV